MGEYYGRTFIADYNDYFIIQEASLRSIQIYSIKNSTNAWSLWWFKTNETKKKNKKVFKKNKKRLSKKARNFIKKIIKKNKKKEEKEENKILV